MSSVTAPGGTPEDLERARETLRRRLATVDRASPIHRSIALLGDYGDRALRPDLLDRTTPGAARYLDGVALAILDGHVSFAAVYRLAMRGGIHVQEIARRGVPLPPPEEIARLDMESSSEALKVVAATTALAGLLARPVAGAAATQVSVADAAEAAPAVQPGGSGTFLVGRDETGKRVAVASRKLFWEHPRFLHASVAIALCYGRGDRVEVISAATAVDAVRRLHRTLARVLEQIRREDPALTQAFLRGHLFLAHTDLAAYQGDELARKEIYPQPSQQPGTLVEVSWAPEAPHVLALPETRQSRGRPLAASTYFKDDLHLELWLPRESEPRKRVKFLAYPASPSLPITFEGEPVGEHPAFYVKGRQIAKHYLERIDRDVCGTPAERTMFFFEVAAS